MWLDTSSISLFLFLWTISLSTSVTVNFRNLTFGSLADRIALANQQKLQNQFEASQSHNLGLTTSSTTTTTVQSPIVVTSTASTVNTVIPPALVETNTIPNKVNQQQESNANSRWCNVSVFKKSRVTWLSAYRTCKRLGNGTELASIKTQEDYDTFVSNVKNAGSPASVIYWTSGTDIIDEGEFVWMSDGSEVTQTWWAPGQPDNHWDTEHCIAFKRYTNETNYKMTDENCLLAGAFICAQPCKFWA